MTNKKKKKIESYIGAIITTAIGGIALLIASVLLNAVLSTPPSRAEFDSFKVKIDTQNTSIDRRLKSLKDGQDNIINIIISKEK